MNEQPGQTTAGDAARGPETVLASNDAEAMVPIAFAPDSIRAHLLSSLLSAQGIETHVIGEHAAAFGPIGGNASVGVQVRRADYPRGVAAINDFLKERSEDPSAPTPSKCLVCGYDLRGLEARDEHRCPECGVSADAVARVRQWIQLARPPRGGTGSDNQSVSSTADDTVEAIGITLGQIVLWALVAGILALLVWLVVYALG